MGLGRTCGTSSQTFCILAARRITVRPLSPVYNVSLPSVREFRTHQLCQEGNGVVVLVIGGAGYIGSHTARALRRAGYDVLLYDNLSSGFRRLAQGFELVEGDIADREKLQKVLPRVDAVMHFAAHAYVGESVENP